MKKISLLAFVSFFSVIAFAQTGKTKATVAPATTTAAAVQPATGKNTPIVANSQTPANTVAFRKANETVKTTTEPQTGAVTPQKQAPQNKQQAAQQKQKINSQPSFSSKTRQAAKS